MNKSKVLVILALLLFVLSVVFQFKNEAFIAESLESLILPIICLLYFITVKRRPFFFTVFLVLFSVSELMVFMTPYVSHDIDYFLGNTLCIAGYISLIIEISKSISLNRIFKHFKIHLFILTMLNIYVIYVLQVIINLKREILIVYCFEMIYNIVLLLILSLALLNYLQKDNIKALYLFLGVLCIVFAEVIWLAYIHLSERCLLSIVSTSLFALAYYFFYKQSKIYREKKIITKHID